MAKGLHQDVTHTGGVKCLMRPGFREAPIHDKQETRAVRMIGKHPGGERVTVRLAVDSPTISSPPSNDSVSEI